MDLAMHFSIIAFPYSTDSDVGTAAGPGALLQAGLVDELQTQAHKVSGPFHVELTPGEQEAYGAWNRIALANAHLAQLTAEAIEAETFPILLESNCYGAVGALAGLQQSTNTFSPRLGMVWIDAHADFNTPETTLSGMLSGMPVAIATGSCLELFRRQAGLNPPLSPSDIVMMCVRANDPLEQDLLEKARIENVPVADIKADCARLRTALERLSRAVDRIYVHLDVDALDAAEVASMWLSAPDGPDVEELGRALRLVMATEKVAALGVSDMNPERDVDGQMMRAALTLIRNGVSGLAPST
jgi:arginase